MYLMVFSPKFLFETLENILETKIFVKKLLNILFSILLKNNILLVYNTRFFQLGIFHRVPPYVDIYIYSIVE